ncbi:MAG TPA: aldehyde dehydrogenase family protein [Vicinamibacteria bacterium]
MPRIANPATGETIREVAEDDARAVAAKYGRARAAQPAWAARPYAERAAALRAFRQRLVDDAEALARLLTGEMGKPVVQSRNELKGVLKRIDFFLEKTEGVLAPEEVHRRGGLEETVTHEPLGVVANVSAWNYPYFVGANVFVPALLTGNAVLYKPSEFATLTGLAIAERLVASGVPEDVFVPVVGARDTGQALVEQPVDGVFFTGSHATGQAIARALAGRLVRLQLELGGKDPVYVADDVDVPKAAASVAEGAFYNAGQSCCAVERVYVHRAVHDAFLEAFVAAVRAFPVGDPLDPGTMIGPLARPAQLAVLEGQVQDAVAKGARVLLGGARLARPGAYFAPTVVAGADHSMELMREESFGPVIGVQEVADDDHALRQMNDTRYGLTAAVYTTDAERARRLLARVQSGSVYWNCCDRVSPRLPWTGRRDSGMGSTLGLEGIRAFLQPKAWHMVAPV